jgi:hypothetical protein
MMRYTIVERKIFRQLGENGLLEVIKPVAMDRLMSAFDRPQSSLIPSFRLSKCYAERARG